MVTTLGTILGTTLGTELGGMQDVAGFDSRLLYALSSLSGSNWYETQAGGGEVGTAAGFGFIVLCRLHQSVASASRAIADNFYTSPIEGWTLNSTGTNNSVIAAFSSGAAASISTPAVALAPSDSGRILALVGQHTGAGATARLSVFRGSYVSQAITGYTAAVARKMAIGKRANVGNIPADGVDLIGKLTFRGVPSDAQIAAVLDAARNGMDLPTAFVGATLTHRISLRDVLAGLDLPVIDGQTAPASLPDTVTAASIDAMARQGSPTVRVIDPGADGRKSYGVINGGPSGASGLATAAGAGIRGSSTALTVGLTAYLSSSGVEMLAGATNSSDAGWGLYVQSTLRFTVRDGSNVAKTLTWTIAPGHHRIVGRVDNANQTLWVDGVQVATQACVGHTPPSGALAMGFGSRPDFTLPAAHSNAYGLTGGAFAATDNEITAWSQSVERTGRIQQIRPGSDEHLYDLTADVVANGGPENGIPGTVQDRIGTDHLTKVGGLVVSGGGLTSFGASGYPQSATVASGLPGLATGLWVEALIVAPPTGTLQNIFSNTGAGPNGLHLRLASNNTPTAIFGDGSVTATAFGPGALTPGQTYHICAVYNGSVGTVYVNSSAGAPTAAFTLAPGALPTKLGTMYNGTIDPATTMIVRGVAGGSTVPTVGEVGAASTYALANGKVGGVAGKTLRRYDIVQDVADAGGKVPALIKDRVSNVDHLAVVGAPLQAAQRAERVWSYETTPIAQGGATWSSANLYASAVPVARGDAAGFWLASLLYLPSGQASQTRVYAAEKTPGGGGGWDLRAGGAFTTISWAMYDATGTPVLQASGSAVVGASDLDRLHLYVGVWDGPGLRQRAYWKRAEVGSGLTRNGYTPSAGGVMRIGHDLQMGGVGGDVLPIYGLAYGVGVPTLAQVQALYDSVQANEQMMGIPGMTNTLLRLGTLPATLIDVQGGATLTKTGTPTAASTYARAWGW